MQLPPQPWQPASEANTPWRKLPTRKPSRSSKTTLGADNPGVAISLNNLAVIYQDQSKYPQAEQAYLQALAILEKDASQKASTGLTLNNLAALYHDEGMDAKAEPVYKRALGIWESLGKNQTANETIAVMGLAGIYHLRNENASAEPLYLRALKLWNESGKTESTEAADALFHLGEINHARSNNTEAESDVRPRAGDLGKHFTNGQLGSDYRARHSRRNLPGRGEVCGSRTSAGTGFEGRRNKSWGRIISVLPPA